MGVDTQPKTIAFIGTGAMAQAHYDAFQDITDVNCIGVYSRTAQNATRFAHRNNIAHIADSIDTLYSQTQADMVVIATSIAATRDVVEACLAHPWSILIEKPAGIHYDDAKALFDTARSKDRHTQCFVGFNRRFLAATQALKDEISHNDHKLVMTVRDSQSIIAAKAYGHPDVVADNFMYANSVHLIDYFTALGRSNIQRITPQITWKDGDAWLQTAQIDYENGDLGLYEGLWEMPGPWSVEIATQAARYELKPLETLKIQDKGQRQWRTHPEHAWDQNFKPGLRLQAEHALKALRGDAGHQLVSLEESLKTMALIRDIYSAAAF